MTRTAVRPRRDKTPPLGALWKNLLPAPAGLAQCGTVLDIGAGVRPMRWYKPHIQHLCLEPYEPYRVVLRAHGYDVIDGEALQVLENPADVLLPALNGFPLQAIYLLDVIEHMPRETGEAVLDHMQALATVQVVIYTPYGFRPQTRDNWGYGGDHWQTHRSGWLPADFPAPHWQTHLYCPVRHGRRQAPEGFFAVWNAPQGMA